MQPYFNCPFLSQGQDFLSMPGMPAGVPLSPLFQSPGIHMPPSVQGFQGMPLMQGMGVMPYSYSDLDGLEDVGPATSSPADPPPVLSDNPASVRIVLFKELTGFSNYGNPSGNADILYTGNRGAWTFNLPFFLLIPQNLRPQLVISAVLDDHSNVPVNRYSATITFNGVTVHTGRLQLPHGSPAGQRFNNWRQLTFNVSGLRRNNRVVIVNTSNTGADDWIGLDWMELRLVQA